MFLQLAIPLYRVWMRQIFLFKSKKSKTDQKHNYETSIHDLVLI